MGKVLRGGAYGPDGGHVAAGEPPAKDWPKWFLADLEAHGQLVDAAELDQPAAAEAAETVTLDARSSRGRKATS